MSELKIDLIDNATQGAKFEVDFDLIEEMAECINNCSWVSAEEIAAYMKGCIAGGGYEPEQWSVDGRGVEAIDRDIIEHNRG